MENKVSLDTNKSEIIKDRGDNLKKVIRPKGVVKKDVENTKDLVKDRGDSLLKPARENVIYPKNTKLNETFNKNFENTSEDLVTDGNKITKNATHNQAVKSKHFGKTVHIKSQNSKQNEPASKGSDKSAPAVMTDRHSVSKPVKDAVLPQNNKHYEVISRSLSKSVPRNSKQNEGKIQNTNDSAAVEAIIDKDSASKIKDESILKSTQHNAITSKINKRKIKNSNESAAVGKAIKRDSLTKLAKDNVILKNIKLDEAIESKYFVETGPIDTAPTNNRQNEPTSKNYEKPVVVRKNIVESEKHTNRLLDIDEKKRIREKYTFKRKAVDRNKILDDKSMANDSHVGDNNDISKTRNNEAENKGKINENKIYDSTKIDKDSIEKSRKRPVIKTIIAKNDATKVYKAVTFAEQMKTSNTPLQIKIPVLLKNLNKPDDAVTGNTKLAKVLPNTDDNFRGNKINQNISLGNDDNLTKNTKKPKISQSSDDQLMNRTKITKLLHNNNEIRMKNKINKTKIPQIDEDNLMSNMKVSKITPNNDKLWRNTKVPTITVMRNTKVPYNNLTKTTKIPKVSNDGDNLKTNSKSLKTSQNSQSNKSESIKGVKTKRSKKEKKYLSERNLSHLSLVKGKKSPVTEVARWAPHCINKHTQPYYEAWVDTTLAAVSRNTVKDKRYYENQQFIKSFKKILDQRPETPELVYENYLDEQYTGKIKIHHKQ